jgi:two-component system response regulator HydG
MIVMSHRDILGLKELPGYFTSQTSDEKTLHIKSSMTLEEIEKNVINDALKKAKGNKSKAAKMLGISRRTLHRKLP